MIKLQYFKDRDWIKNRIMKHQNNKIKFPYLWSAVYGILLAGYVTFTLLDTFVLPKDLVYIGDITEQNNITTDATAATVTTAITVTTAAATADLYVITPKETSNTQDIFVSESQSSKAQTFDVTASAVTEEPIITESEEAVITETGYQSSSILISITHERVNDTEVYIGEVIIKDPSLLKAGLANDSFGRNLKQYTSTIAANNNAIFAINGDYYGFRESGYVMRNGYMYRTNGRSGEQCDGMAIFDDGHMEVYKEPEIDAQALADRGAVQIFCFGPALIKDSEILVNEDSEVEMSWNDNPRTAIGQISPLHYLFVVSDGRTDESRGLSLNSLALFMKSKGCNTAYNLDGGGSSTMWFMGKVVNVPTDGRRFGERGISDIVYIGE